MKNKLIRLNIFAGILLLLVGIVLKNMEIITNFLAENRINLSLAEVDTNYDNNDSYEEKLRTLAYNDTTWLWPTTSNYSITQSYSPRHPAIDIVPNGDLNAYSTQNGVVITNSYKWDNGNYIVIKLDNGKYLMYAHLSQKLVKEGDRVTKGQVIGIIGRTGYATGVHLHFAVWDGYPHASNPRNPHEFY